MHKLGFILVCGLVANVAHAAVGDKEIIACATNQNSVERLACFDELAARHSLAPSSTDTTKADDIGMWHTNTKTNPLNDKPVHTAILTAKEGMSRHGKSIGLVVRCKNNKTDMYIVWNDFLGRDGIHTTYRVGKEKAKSSSWSVSTDKRAAFFPGSPVPLLKAFADNTSFVANVTPYNENPVTAVFDIAGVEVALADIRNDCHW